MQPRNVAKEIFAQGSSELPSITRSYRVNNKRWIFEFSKALNEDHMRLLRRLGNKLRNLRNGMSFSFEFLKTALPGKKSVKVIWKLAVDRSRRARLSLGDIVKRVLDTLQSFIPTNPVEA